LNLTWSNGHTYGNTTEVLETALVSVGKRRIRHVGRESRRLERGEDWADRESQDQFGHYGEARTADDRHQSRFGRKSNRTGSQEPVDEERWEYAGQPQAADFRRRDSAASHCESWLASKILPST